MKIFSHFMVVLAMILVITTNFYLYALYKDMYKNVVKVAERTVELQERIQELEDQLFILEEFTK